jgi:succinoglycan biosynthesis transport protein ExoP
MSNEFDIDDDGGLDIDILGTLRRRYPLIILGLFVGLLGAALYYSQQVPQFQSSLTVYIGQRSSEAATTGRATMEGTSVQVQILATHAELFTSPKVVGDAVAKGNLHRLMGIGSAKEATVIIRSGLKVSQGGTGPAAGASLLTASFQHTDAEVAAEVLTAVYDAYKDYIDSQSRNISGEAADLIARALVENEQAVRDADEAYRDNVARMPALVTADGRLSDVHRTRLTNIEAELSTVRSSLSRARSKQGSLEEFLESRAGQELSFIDAMSMLGEQEVSRLTAAFSIGRQKGIESEEERQSAIMAELNRTGYGRLWELTTRRDALLDRFGPGHSAVEAVNSQIASIEEQMRQTQDSVPEFLRGENFTPIGLLQNYLSVLKNDVRELGTRERELEAESEKESGAAKVVEELFMSTLSLRKTLDRAESRYDEVFKRLQEINLTSDYAGFTTDLIAPAEPNYTRVWPSKTRIFALGFVAGAMVGLGLGLLAELTDRTFKTPEDVEKTLGTSILVHVPKLELSRLQRKAIADSAVDPMVTALHSPRGSEAETFRLLRTSVLFAAKKDGQKVFMVTSPSPGDGKSTTISNLAVSLAQTGKRVLLVDADMRRPTIGKKFGVDRRPGLSDYLQQRFELEECLQSTEQVNLVICPDGTKTSGPAELLESPRFAEFIAEARQRFDYVLIDTPPVLAVADPVIVAENADGVLLTLRIEKKNRQLVERAHEVLSEHGANLLGLVVNATESSRRGYGYSSYNYYGKKEYGYVAAYRSYYAASDSDDDSGNDSGPRSKSRSSRKSSAKSSPTKPPKSPASV